MIKVFVVGGNMAVTQMILNAGHKVVDSVESSDLVCFTGGEDVNPALYGEKNVKSYINVNRDRIEAEIFLQAKDLKKAMVGICRGGQFLNVMSGGKMWQDVDMHAMQDVHDINCSFTGETYKVSSTHHQMMRPSSSALVLAVADRSCYKVDELGTHEMTKADRDAEVVFYPETNCLCFQPHPEFFGPGHECFDYFFQLIGHQLAGTLK